MAAWLVFFIGVVVGRVTARLVLPLRTDDLVMSAEWLHGTKDHARFKI